MQIAPIAAPGLGTVTVVPAPLANQKLRIYGWIISCGGVLIAQWFSGATAVTGLYYGVLGSQIPNPVLTPRGDPASAGPTPQFDCAPGQPLRISISGTAGPAGGHVIYDIVHQNLG